MLAAHRDQENLVHNRQIPTKQQPKTPCSRYPKTPSKFVQNDENLQTIFRGKPGVSEARGKGGNEKLSTNNGLQGPGLVTPMGNTSRAPLGNKTTNAKAKAAQSAGVKGIVRDIEKTRLGPTTVQKPKQRLAPLIPTFEVQADKNKPTENDEPEYAPPNPQPLPYESDVLPRGGLTFEGLKKKNLLRGYYANFHNPVDRNGVSRLERQFQREMDQVTQQAIKQNDECLDSLSWGVDISPQKSSRVVKREEKPSVKAAIKQPLRRQANTVNAKKAASSLGLQPTGSRAASLKVSAPNVLAKRSVSINRPQYTADSGTTASPGEAASRTTIGYNKGRATSNLIYGRHKQRATPLMSKRSRPAPNPEATVRAVSPEKSTRPQFASIFYDDDDGDDLVSFNCPSFSGSDGEEEFELKLDV